MYRLVVTDSVDMYVYFIPCFIMSVGIAQHYMLYTLVLSILTLQNTKLSEQVN